MKNLTWQNPEQLFVAQVLINQVKSKCCGIKDIEKGGKLGRKVGSVKTEEQMKAEYREVISLLRKGYSIRDVAKLSG